MLDLGYECVRVLDNCVHVQTDSPVLFAEQLKRDWERRDRTGVRIEDRMHNGYLLVTADQAKSVRISTWTN